MPCPILSELPSPPAGKVGWPWTEQTVPLGSAMPDGAPWPRVSVITPSFNQEQFIEETIRSVLLQGYPNLEYIVIDGGSSDGSVGIIRKYEPWLAYWISESDRGQAHALNKGFARATGSLLTWINSDDMFLRGALAVAGRTHRARPEAILLGDAIHFSQIERIAFEMRAHHVTFPNFVAHWRRGWGWNQPGTFFPRVVWEQIGQLDDGLRYNFDRDWMCRALYAAMPVAYLHALVAAFRLHPGSKTVGEMAKWHCEQLLVTERYAVALPALQQREIWSGQEIAQATLCLSFLYFGAWNARAAAHHLGLACRFWPAVLLTFNFWQLCARMLCPLPLVRLLRMLWLRPRRNASLFALLPGSDPVPSSRPANHRDCSAEAA